MKKLIIIVMAVFLLAVPNICLGGASGYNLGSINAKIPTDFFGNGGPRDHGTNALRAIDAMNLDGVERGIGIKYFVDSNVSSAGDGLSWSTAVATIQEGADLCSANVGDIVNVAQWHNEAVIAADGIDIDTAGITIRGYGDGPSMPTIDYDHADGEFVIGAANVTIINLRFNASVTIVTHAIDIENAGDYATIAYCEFPDGELPGTDEFVDTIQVGTTATNPSIIGCEYFSTGTGTNNFVDLSAATIAKATIIGNTIYGAFAEAGIWAGAAVPTNVTCKYNTVTNTTSGQLGIEFAGNATGVLSGNMVSTDAIGTSYDVGFLEELEVNLWDDYGSRDTSPVPWTTNETGVDRWGASELAQIEAEATDALEADHLDHLFAVSVADEIVDDSFAADITTIASDWSDFDATTDSLEAIANGVNGTTLIAGRTYTVINETVDLGDADLFAVAGGPILITSLTGLVTETVAGAAETIKIIFDATDDFEFSTAVDVTGIVRGSRIVFSAANPAVLTPLQLAGVGSGNTMVPWFCPVGSIEVVDTDDNSQNGIVSWYMTFIPLQTGVTVTAQ